MKVITIKQPWATLISKGYKEYEFRSWKTKYRGPILIHAGKGIDKKAIEKFKYLNLDYPQSRVIAEATLDDCIHIDETFDKKLSENQIYGTDNKTGIYAWKLSQVKLIDSDKYIKGQLGLWNIENL